MREISGDHSGGETPVPIQNTAVKPTCADGTALATGWESRSLPGISLLFSAPRIREPSTLTSQVRARKSARALGCVDTGACDALPYAALGTGPSRTPNTFPSGSWNHAPRAGPTWAMKLVVFGDSYSSKVTPR